jgi:superfamily II RNA helicase
MMKPKWSEQHIFDLVDNLYKNKMLPAIVFLNSCDQCDKLAQILVSQLKHLEEEEMRDSGKMKKTEKETAKLAKLKKKSRDRKNNGELDKDEYEFLEEQNMIVPLINHKYSFLDSKYKLTENEILEEINLHKFRKIPSYFFDGWKRGIGVHHANYHTKFRNSVEYLFRKRHLQIVFATKTLALGEYNYFKFINQIFKLNKILGINMPCKTVCMPTDCIYINSIYYRHMIGRAGRRGFDTIGNIGKI